MSSSAYSSVIKGGLKLKGKSTLTEVGVKTGGKKKKSQHQEEVEALKALARQKEAEDAELTKAANREPTACEKATKLARETRKQARCDEAIQYTHRERMDRLNKHLCSLSEHFDIPKVGPG
mmetsp:Transcript_135402/g.239522  ORF Transcript_135402/g.239522 Transcript_135402/m.239522 type:complete len:121 (+) Transcript_135402:135-497(+)